MESKYVEGCHGYVLVAESGGINILYYEIHKHQVKSFIYLYFKQVSPTLQIKSDPAITKIPLTFLKRTINMQQNNPTDI